MDRLVRIIVYGAIAAALAPIGLIAAFFAVNASDEALSPEAQRMLERPANPYAPAENLMVALAGFDAPKGESTIAAGEKVLAEHDRIAGLPRGDRDAAREKARAEAPQRLRVAGDFDCRPLVRSCWAAAEARRNAHRGELEANAELYRRYGELHALRGYFDATQPSETFPGAFVPAQVRSLFLQDVALRVKDARTPQERSGALAVLDRDIRTWRAMLTGHGTIVSKFIAIANLHGDYALLADMLGDGGVELRPHFQEIETMLGRVQPEDWKVTGALDYEFRTIADVYDSVDPRQVLAMPSAAAEKAPWWQSLLPGDLWAVYLLNATKNLAARHMLEVKRFAQADGAFRTEHERLQRWREKHLAPGFAWFRNPVGHILVAVAPESYDAFPLRAHDVAGFHRLVRLAFDVRREGAADDAMPAFIRQRAWAVHPVSGEPFAWDTDKRELVMTPLAPANKERRFRVPVK